MVDQAEGRLSPELTYLQVESMETPLTEFAALHHIPRTLGFNAHSRLEDILGTPIASSDAEPEASNSRTGQQAGQRLGDIVGREREFLRNLPQIRDNIKAIAEERGVREANLWDEVVEVLSGSGMSQPMHRTLDRPLGGAYGARDYIEQHAGNGIALLVRGGIANWEARRHDRAMSLIGNLSRQALQHVELVIYAGGQRQYTGPSELWRPEIVPYVQETDNGPISYLTEATAAAEIYLPKMYKLLGELGIGQDVEFSTVSTLGKGSTDVLNAIAAEHGDQLKDGLIIEVGNAPAGYTLLAAGVHFAENLGIDPTEQYVAVADGVEIVHPDHFQALDVMARSKIQNGATGLNSFNGWIGQITQVNRFLHEASTHA